jgi:hypothetical protein
MLARQALSTSQGWTVSKEEMKLCHTSFCDKKLEAMWALLMFSNYLRK